MFKRFTSLLLVCLLMCAFTAQSVSAATVNTNFSDYIVIPPGRSVNLDCYYNSNGGSRLYFVIDSVTDGTPIRVNWQTTASPGSSRKLLKSGVYAPYKVYTNPLYSNNYQTFNLQNTNNYSTAYVSVSVYSQ